MTFATEIKYPITPGIWSVRSLADSQERPMAAVLHTVPGIDTGGWWQPLPFYNPD
ncbi:hypothetical protein [Komagataeibacter sp. FNDCF1]|uniref:hypothetical protein n=1 Tax=Komagataeibacter sp. FNDCF1 TaxID=2878681 RepID=UPI001E413C12|nr:hypothetical protein [Komagataeibacter sp. FNDCF1]MCE2563056.1 hypothetical protein [Komagataeibacter sp. FNDCF1]